MIPHPLQKNFENSSISEKTGFPKEGILAIDATRHPKLLEIGPNHGCHAYRYSCCKSLSAITPMAQKKNRNMYPFLAFLVIILDDMTIFMHKTCTEQNLTNCQIYGRLN